MKQEWETLQQNPTAVDDQIKAQLEILEQINNSAFKDEPADAKDSQPDPS